MIKHISTVNKALSVLNSSTVTFTRWNGDLNFRIDDS